MSTVLNFLHNEVNASCLGSGMGFGTSLGQTWDCGQTAFTDQLTQSLSLTVLLSITTLLDSEGRKSWRLKESQEHDGEGGEP